MNCLAIMESGNYALALVKNLEEEGIQCQVVSTPCKLSKEGCGYSVRFNLKDKEDLVKIALQNGIIIKSFYKIIKDTLRTKYHKFL